MHNIVIPRFFSLPSLFSLLVSRRSLVSVFRIRRQCEPLDYTMALGSAVSLTAFCNPMASLSPSILTSPPVTGVAYCLVANTVYLARRSHLLSRRKPMSMLQLLKIRTMREDGVSWPLHFMILMAWQAFVVLFPLAESVAYACKHVSLFYSYPNASGCGIILEPRSMQHLPQSKRVKHQIRFDWHRFSINVGNIGREGYRHPPSVQRNLPHVDIPKKGLKHWPWRRREVYDRPEKGNKK